MTLAAMVSLSSSSISASSRSRILRTSRRSAAEGGWADDQDPRARRRQRPACRAEAERKSRPPVDTLGTHGPGQILLADEGRPQGPGGRSWPRSRLKPPLRPTIVSAGNSGMTASTNNSSPGRPRVNATPVNVRFPPTELEALDRWIAKHSGPKPTRPEAIRQIVTEHLTEGGHLRSRRDLRPSKQTGP